MQLYIQSHSSKATGQFIGAGVKQIGCILLLLNLLLHSSAAPSTLPAVDEVASVKSVFLDNPQFGKDPFFPKSSRRAVTVEVSITNTVVEPFTQVTGLLLKGISGIAGKRLAIINNRTFEAGEEMTLRVGNQIFKVRCVEIREKSVIVSVNGQTKELFLGQRP